MSKIKLALLAGVASGALALGTTQANATSYALSLVQITNLEMGVFSGGGSDPEDLVPFDPEGAFNFSATTGASLTGFAGESDSDTRDSPFSLDRGLDTTSDAPTAPFASATPDTVDPTQAALGTAPDGVADENNYSPIGDANGGTTGSSFARADHHLTDTLVNKTGEGAGAGFGGDFDAIAETQVDGSGTDGAGTSGNQQFWDFGSLAVAPGSTFEIEFDLDYSLLALTTADEATPASADANFIITFSFVDNDTSNGDDSFNISLGDTVNAGPEGDSVPADDTGFEGGLLETLGIITIVDNGVGGVHVTISDIDSLFDSEFFANDTDETFSFNIAFSNAANADSNTQQVPEPLTLGLMGAGLLGLGAVARRRRSA